MKHLVLFLLAATAAFAADFMTGQAARITIGQTTFTSQDADNPSQYQIGAVSGVAYANNTLFVVDSNHIQATPVLNRVLIYQNISRYITNPTSEIAQGLRCPVCVGTPQVGGADLVLGQPNFANSDIGLTQTNFRTPSYVATNGNILVVSDTDNNRVLIWKTIPTSNDVPPDLEIGQPNFTTGKSGTDAKTMRGPQGVWIQGTRLFVADTQNSRVMVWNTIPTSNGQAADYVLGQPNLTATIPITSFDVPPTASNLFSPVSVTSDGQRLFVSDLGHSRVLIWNSIPTTNGQAADVVVGQPDMISEGDNNTAKVCPSNGVDSSNNPTYPNLCKGSLSSPRFALSDGQRLFIADSGNDRVMVYNTIPTQNAANADVILGQPDDMTNVVTDSTDTFRPDANILSSSPNTIRTPLGLAWDGTNLYVTDPYDRRVLVFTVGIVNVPINGIVNSYSRTVFALGTIDFSGTITAGDKLTITINGTDYAYTVVAADTLETIITNLANLINGKTSGTPDPFVIATPNLSFDELVLTAKQGGPDGNNVTYAVATSTNSTTTAATEILTASGAQLTGGQSAAEVAPGTLVTINGSYLTDVTATGTPDSNGYYPGTLGGVEVYFDGIKAPLFYVSPGQIQTQIPLEVNDANGISAFVRTLRSDGTLYSSTAVSVPVVGQNPGILAMEGTDPRTAIAYHTSSSAIAVVSVDGSVEAGDAATIQIEDRTYTYGTQASDSLDSVRDALIAEINANSEEKVVASAAGQFDRIILTAKVTGPDGEGIAVTATAGGAAPTIVMTALNSATCCASAGGTQVTPDNPATPGELITVFATGIGLVTLPDNSAVAGVTGQVYTGPRFTVPEVPVDNAQVGGITANVLEAGLAPGMVGVYEVQLQISDQLPTNYFTQVYIAQSVFTSNIVTIPVVVAAPAIGTGNSPSQNSRRRHRPAISQK